MSNIITANFTDGKFKRVTFAYQYDYGQVLLITGIDLPQTYEVHFCNTNDAITVTQLGTVDGVAIPDALLQTGKDIEAYVYLHTGDSDGETEYKISIPVRERPEPSDEEYPPEQQSALEEAVILLNSAIDEVDEIINSISITDPENDGNIVFTIGRK